MVDARDSLVGAAVARCVCTWRSALLGRRFSPVSLGHTAFLNLSHQDFVTVRTISGRLIGRTCTLHPGQTNVPPFESP